MLKKLLIVVAVLALVGGFFLTKDYDSPELGQRLLGSLGDATGLDIRATGFRFNLFRGVELTEVTARSTEDGRSLDFALDTLLFEHRLGPLLSGTVAVDRVLLQRPRITLVETETAAGEPSSEGEAEKAAPEAPAADASGEGGGLALEVKEIVVADGTLVLQAGDGAETRVEGLDFNMADLSIDPSAGSLAGIGARGELAVDRIALDGMTLSEVASEFALASSVFDLTGLSFDSEHGSFRATARVDFGAVPFEYTMQAEGDPLDLNGMTGASADGGFGPATITLDAKGSGPDVADVVADGTLNLAEGQFPAIGMISGIDEALGKQVVTGGQYEATTAQVHLEDNVVRLAPFRFTSEMARLDLEGTVNLAGPLALNLAVATPREGLNIAGAGGAVLDVLADDSGWVPIPMTVSGTLEESRVRPDTQALTAQAKSGAKREVKEAATEAAEGALRGLFGRKKKN